MKITDAINAFLALGQESRLNVFRLIVQKGDVGVTPTQIKELLGIPAATISFHIKQLMAADLILMERQSRNLIYRPNPSAIQALMDFLMQNCCGGNACLPILNSTILKNEGKSDV
jgi:ArsR family transcriptional regulator, arsenate/arsenite/antimonite-responsive transcriptional repressor